MEMAKAEDKTENQTEPREMDEEITQTQSTPIKGEESQSQIEIIDFNSTKTDSSLYDYSAKASAVFNALYSKFFA